MSRQLSRIRSIISEIEEIQKQGQAEGRAQMQQRPMVLVTQQEEPAVLPLDSESVADGVLEQPEKAGQEVGKIAIQLTGNIVVALQIENTNETVEIRQVHDSIEIRFADGKAVHLPLKNVA